MLVSQVLEGCGKVGTLLISLRKLLTQWRGTRDGLESCPFSMKVKKIIKGNNGRKRDLYFLGKE